MTVRRENRNKAGHAGMEPCHRHSSSYMQVQHSPTTNTPEAPAKRNIAAPQAGRARPFDDEMGRTCVAIKGRTITGSPSQAGQRSKAQDHGPDQQRLAPRQLLAELVDVQGGCEGCRSKAGNPQVEVFEGAATKAATVSRTLQATHVAVAGQGLGRTACA